MSDRKSTRKVVVNLDSTKSRPFHDRVRRLVAVSLGRVLDRERHRMSVVKVHRTVHHVSRTFTPVHYVESFTEYLMLSET